MLLWTLGCMDSSTETVSKGAEDQTSFSTGHVLLALGDWAGEGHTDFHNIVGALVDRRAGVLVVAGAGDGTIRTFGLDGEWRDTRGGRGDGPREFLRLDGVFDYRGDSLVAYDRGDHHAAVWPYRAGRVRRVSVVDLPADLSFPTLRGALGDGRLLWTAETVDNRFDEPGFSHVRQTTVFLTAPDGYGFQAVGKTTGAMLYRYPLSTFARGMAPFSPRSFANVHDSIVYFGSTQFARGERVTTTGAPLESVPFDLSRRAVSIAEQELDIAVRRSEVEGLPPTPLQAARLRELEVLPYPDSFPAMGAVVVGRDGRVWVAEYQPPQTGADQAFLGSLEWSAYSESGNGRQHYRFPGRFTLLWADEVLAVGVVRDTFDVEQILIFPVRAEEGDGSQ